jgi:predicted TIM-barrel fold metal-dependent hydrolase
MKVIDGHVFVGKTIYMNQSPKAVISNMDRLGMEASVVVAPPPGPFYKDANRFVREAARKYPRRLAALYRANPHLEGEAERVKAALTEQGFVGVQLDPTNDGYGINGSIVNPLISLASEHEAPVYIHSGDSIFCPPEYVADVAARFEAVNFVTTMSSRAPRAAQACKNLYLMTHPFPTLAFQSGHAEDFDIDRLIFASESPIGSLEVEIRGVELAGLDPTAREKVLGGNLRRIMILRQG